MSYRNNQQKNKEIKGLEITGKIRVFPRQAKNYLFYGSSFYNKDGDRIYYDIQFTKDNNPQLDEAFDILINNSFFTVDNYKNNLRLKLVITDFDMV